MELAQAEEDAGLDLACLWTALRLNRLWILSAMAFALIAGLAATYLATPVYRAQSSVRIEQQVGRVLGTEDAEPPASLLDMDRYLETQLDVIRSRDLAERVARDLELFDNDDFLKTIKTDGKRERRDAVLDTLGRNMSVTLPRNSRVARIGFDSPDPALAAAVANSFAANFVAASIERKSGTILYARDVLSGRLAEARERLEGSELAMIAYARAAGLIDTSNGVINEQQAVGPRSLKAASMVQLNGFNAAAIANRIQAQEKWMQASAMPPLSLPDVLANPAIQQLVQQRAEQKALYEQERQRRREEFPAMRQAEARIGELDRQISTLAASIKSGIRGQYDVASNQERALARTLARLKGEALAEQDRSVRYNILKREAETNRLIYEALLQRYREIAAAAGIAPNTISILDRAYVPADPVSPRPFVNMILAALGGLMLSLLLIVTRARFKREPGA